MHPLLWVLKGMHPVSDRATVDRLVAGRADPADLPAGYAGLARLLAAITAPAAPEELAGEAAVLAQFTALMHSPLPTSTSRRMPVLSRIASVKVAAAALVALLSVGGVAAATGLLPTPAQRVADQVPASTGAGVAGQDVGAAAVADLDAAAKQGLCRAWPAGQDADNSRRAESPAFRALAVAAGGADSIAAYCKDVTAGGSPAHGQGRAAVVGPDAMAAAREGLCRAWQAGQGADHGRREDSVAFQALAAAAGGADQVAAFCKGATPGSVNTHGQGQGASPTSVSPPSTTTAPPSSGPPADTGPAGHGRGGPPTTTG
jgi:hypothetical protein